MGRAKRNALLTWREAYRKAEGHKAFVAAMAALRAEHDQREKVESALKAAQRCLGFFRSVIKSGEPWTNTCEKEFATAMQATDREGK